MVANVAPIYVFYLDCNIFLRECCVHNPTPTFPSLSISKISLNFFLILLALTTFLLHFLYLYISLSNSTYLSPSFFWLIFFYLYDSFFHGSNTSPCFPPPRVKYLCQHKGHLLIFCYCGILTFENIVI